METVKITETSTIQPTKMAVFWDVALCSLAYIDRRFRGHYCLHNHGESLWLLPTTSMWITLTMKAVSSSGTLVKIYQTTRCNSQENSHSTLVAVRTSNLTNTAKIYTETRSTFVIHRRYSLKLYITFHVHVTYTFKKTEDAGLSRVAIHLNSALSKPAVLISFVSSLLMI
jgi:hypothetical protein